MSKRQPENPNIVKPQTISDAVAIRVPAKRFTLPNPTGTSVAKYDAMYALPLLLDMWKPRIGSDPSLRPKAGAVPEHLPQYIYIDSVEGERSRLEAIYGQIRGDSGLPRVEALLPGERLWEEIKKVGEYITRRTQGYHTFDIEGSQKPIPKDASPFDVLDLPFEIESDEEEDIETDADRERAEKAKAEAEKKAARKAARQAILVRKSDEQRKKDAKKAKAESAELEAAQVGDGDGEQNDEIAE